MSKRLEDFIRNNKNEFDDLEPRANLWDNIESQLFIAEPEKVIELPKKREAKTFSLGFVLRVAAIVIMIMGISFVFYIKSTSLSNKVNIAAINPEYARQQVQYASLVK